MGDALDALVAAPGRHRLVFQNARVGVLYTSSAPGERTPVHTHRWPVSHHVVRSSDFARRDAEGAVLVDVRAAGSPRLNVGVRQTRKRSHWRIGRSA